ncbi:MAG: hypothetical protein PF637_00140 [Spirochaetes bacterium]|jgi:hypothetical protein|nr:hypothetical protein [Spirochaetota bacterium]
MRPFYVLLLLFLFFTGCFVMTQKIPKYLQQPENQKSTIIGIKVQVKNNPSLKAKRVVFCRLQKSSDMYKSPSCVISNYWDGEYAYLINEPPGKYVAVAAEFTLKKERYCSYFSKEMIKETELSVQKSEIAFLGDFRVNNSMAGSQYADEIFKGVLTKLAKPKSYQKKHDNVTVRVTIKPGKIKQTTLKESDKAQQHYFSMLYQNFEGAKYHYKGSYATGQRGESVRSQFISRAKEVFKDTSWSKIIH